MAGRIAREVLLVLAVTVALAYLVTVLVYAGSAGDDVAHVLLEVAPRFMAGFFGVALVVFALLITIGSIALRRRRAMRVWAHLAAAVIAALANALLITGLATAASGGGGMDGLVLTLAISGSVFFLVTAVVAVLVVQLLVLRRVSGAR